MAIDMHSGFLNGLASEISYFDTSKKVLVSEGIRV
jgi:hypothetical protein